MARQGARATGLGVRHTHAARQDTGSAITRANIRQRYDERHVNHTPLSIHNTHAVTRTPTTTSPTTVHCNVAARAADVHEHLVHTWRGTGSQVVLNQAVPARVVDCALELRHLEDVLQVVAVIA